RNSVRFGLMMGAAAMALLSAGVGYAQETAAPVAQAEPEIADYVIVTGVRYRDRSAEIAPTLEYGLDYFQQFEPLTVGDMLKRTPSTAFISDVLEYDGVRLRNRRRRFLRIADARAQERHRGRAHHQPKANRIAHRAPPVFAYSPTEERPYQRFVTVSQPGGRAPVEKTIALRL
ncbi:MAG: hypothetical protein HXY22_11170, partial [Alphaproteobacteria bacterium]|nr:hypothetical protein [Alphaproteobacteria bacterium]